MNGEKIFVTGGTGFIGLHLVDRLIACGAEVTCLVRKSSKIQPLQSRGVRIVYGDLASNTTRLAKYIKGHRYVLHLAGLARAVKIEQMNQVNVGGFDRVLNACHIQPTPPTVVFISSLAAAGPSDFNRPHCETDVDQPVSNYGYSKRAAEKVATKYCSTVEISIVRPPIVLGPSDSSGLTLFKNIDDWGVHVIPGFRRKRFSIIHVEDLCDGIIAVANNGKRMSDGRPSCGTYYVASDQSPTFGELGEMINRALGRRRVHKVPLPGIAVWTVAAFNSFFAKILGQPRLLDLDKAREGLAGSWTCAAEKLYRDTGFRPRLSLQQRLDQTAAWYRKAGWIGPAKSDKANQQAQETLHGQDSMSVSQVSG